MARWEHFEHEADAGVRGIGATLEQAFAQTALALTALSVEPESIESKAAIQIECRAADPELLLVDWLNALIYQMAVDKILFARFDVNIDGDRLQATAWGERIELEKHRPAVEPKGATYTELKVHQNSDGEWVAQCVVDV